MENFIGKVIKIVSGDKGTSKDYWIDDSKCKACYECESAFSQWNRRHHCRICGRVFCGNCTRNSIPPPRESADQQWLRVCNYCYRVRQRSDQPAVRVQHHRVGSQGSSVSALSQSGSHRQLPDAGFVTGLCCSDGSTPSLAGSRYRIGAFFSRWSRHSSVHRVSSGDLSWSVPPPLEDDFGMSLADRDARLLYQQQLEAGLLAPDAQPKANSLWEVHRQLFCQAADAHLRAVVQQLLMAESVPQPEMWAPIVSAAAQAVAAYLSPSQMFANSQHDPRQSLKIKKVADVGRPEDTCVVTGVVVCKGLVHRKMRTYVEYPKVLLLLGSLDYQRDPSKLSSFDHMDHDKQYLANAIARLSVLKPDVVLVEGSVARMAQEDLLSRNISVAQHIKARVLERLARAMGISVAPTVEHLNPGTAQKYLGDCKVFRVKAETINMKARASEPADAAAVAATGHVSSLEVDTSSGTVTPGTVTPAGSSRTHSRAPSSGPPHGSGTVTPAPGSRTHSRAPSTGPAYGSDPVAPSPCSGSHSRAPSSGEPLPPAAAALATHPQAPLEMPVPQAFTDHQASTTAGELMQAGAAGSEGVASEAVQQPPADDQQAKYTSLSAAMMMKALGSGPNAAAAVALVSAGSGALPSVMAFRPWASTVSSAVPTTPAPAQGTSAGSAGGQGGPDSLGTEARSTPAAVPSGAPAPHRGVGRMAPQPVPAGPPAPPQVTLMYFEGCRPINSTVLLKGAGLEVLRKLRSVVSFAVLTAWNQRLESAFLADLLTAAVASAGEEAYSAWAAATNTTSINASVSTNIGAISLPSGASSLGPGVAQVLSMPSLSSASFSPSLSLGFFRQHAEQAICTSLASASASGIPGILLSISPHCNAWDESLIAEWEQQGFTFPHLQHHHHHHHNYTHGHGHGRGRQLQRSLDAGPRTQARLQQEQQQVQAQQQQAVDEAMETPKTAGQAGDAGRSTAAVAVTTPGLAVTADAADAGVGLQEEPTLAMASGSESTEHAKQQPVPAEGDGNTAGQRQQQAAAPDRDAGDLMVPPDFVLKPSATTLMSPFIAAAAAAAASITAGAEPSLTPQVECISAGGPPEVPATAGLADQQDALATETQEPRHGGGAAASASVAAEGVSAPQSNLIMTKISGQVAVTETAAATGGSEVGTEPQEQQPTPQRPAGSVQPGEREQQQQSMPSPPQERQQQQLQQQDAVTVLQGQRIYSHQRIFVTCMFRRSRDRNLCDPFQVKQIDYYHRSSDVPLIRYIKMCTQLGWTCPGLGCPEPFTAHESVFFFGCHKLTVFYSTLPPIQALPGEERNQIWHWTRPIGRGREGAASCRRVPLSQDACYVSMGRFLELSFSADGLDVFGRSLHYDHVRYFGLGRTLVCMFPERTSVYVMQLPDVVMSYSQQAQTKWLRQEGAELVQEASDAFDLIELMLAESPHFSGGGAAAISGAAAVGGGSSNMEAALQQASTAGGDAATSDAAAAAAAVVTPGSSPGAASSATAAAAAPTAAPASSVLAPLLVAVRKDRQSFLALVADCLARCAPSASPHSGAPSPTSVPWDELVISGIRELNRLRCVLAKAVLQWASRLQDPGGFMAHYNRVTSGGGGGGGAITGGGSAGRPMYRAQPILQPQPHLQPLSHPMLSSSPRTSAPVPSPAAPLALVPDAAATGPTAAASTSQPAHTQLDQPGVQMSESSMSLFGSTSPAVAAYRLGLMPGQFVTTAPPSEAASFTSGTSPDFAVEPPHPQLPQAADTTVAHALPIPIVPHMNGPLSVHAVAEMVAQQELRGGGELLEGSRALLGAAGGPAVAAMATAVAAQQGAADRPGYSRSELHSGSAAAAGPSSSLCSAAEGAAASMSPGLPSQNDGGAAASASSRSTSQASGSGLVTIGSSSKRLSLLGRLSTGGGGIAGLDAAVAGAALGGATHTPCPGGLGAGALAGPRGSSLPRSASVSTIGDMADLSYLAGISGDSGVEDNDDGEEGREDADDEDPDHDTFLAFMGSAPSGGAAFQAGAGSRGPGGATAGGRLAMVGVRGGVSGDSGDDVADEVADGAYYYRALFSHGVGGEGAGDGETVPQPLLQVPQPLLPAEPLQMRKVQHHPLLPHDDEEQGQGQHRLRATVPNGQSSAPAPHSSSPPSATVSPPVGVAASGSAAQSQGSAAGGVTGAHVPVHHPTEPFPITVAGAMPLVPATESFGAAAAGGPDAAGAAAVTTFSRRQLMVQVKRRLESVAAATIGGSALARGFIPLPGRATLTPGVNDTSIPIFDNEPTSIIAYALSTRAYQQQINAGYKAIFGKARAESNRERERDREPTATALAPVLGTSEQPQMHGVAAVGTQSGSQSATPTGPAAVAGVAAGASAGGPTQGTGITASGSSGQGAATATGPVSTCMPASATAAAPTTQVASTAACPQQPQPAAAAMPPPPLPAGQLGSSPDAEWWTVLTSKEACHVRVAFEDDARSMPWARARFMVMAHFAPQFAELRRRCIQGGEAAFVASMCRCKRWESRGGKSNAYFAKTRDERYIIKSLSKSEKASFVNFAPHYFAHMGRHLLNRDSPTCLAKILGVYSVTFKPQPGTAGLEGAGGGGPAGMAAGAALIKELKDREFSQDLLVMENCFYDRPVARIYDLKGSERNRFNADAASRPEDHLEVHLDDNLRRTMHTNPIFVDARSRHQMEAAVWADTGFLAGQDVMDYSLLVGVDKENGVLALAIIDFIRQYTWDKQLETWVKSSGMLGGNGKEPTIISPKQYMRRFRAAMQQYFTAVPGSAGSEVPKDPDAVA